jgi:hypothetical protein
MKKQKNIGELIRRYEGVDFTAYERFSLGMLMLFFIFMMFMFFVLPKL